MFKQLLISEFSCNRTFLAFSLLINLGYGVIGFRSAELMEFMAVTLVSFYVLLIIAASYAGHEKRNRQYMQLPVNASQVFMAGWSFVLTWLGLQVLAWFAFAMLSGGGVDSTAFNQIASAGVGVALMITLVSIAIDLSAFRPAFVQWLYIGLGVFLLALAIHYDVSLGIDTNDSGIRVLPLHLFAEGNLAIGIGLVMFVVAMFADYLVFRFSDNYLG